MSIDFRSVAIALSVFASACTSEPMNFGAFPAEDEPGVTAVVSKAEAIATAQTALEGLSEASYAKWTTQWDTSLTDAIGEDDFLAFQPDMERTYGAFIELEEARLTAAAEPGFVRYSFLGRFELDYLMLVQVYPADGTRIFGVHLRDPDPME